MKKKEVKKCPAMDNLNESKKKELEKYVKDYMLFLDKARTPRMTVDEMINMVTSKGFVEYSSEIKYMPGFYLTNENHSCIALVKLGKKSIEEGIRIVGAHTDSPCLHLKPHPLKECPLGVRLDSQPYGGINSWEWFDRLVRVVGVVIKNGKEIVIDFEGTIMDPAPHLVGKDVMDKKVKDAFDKEDLDILTGYRSKGELLKKLGIEEKDFGRAELYVVPIEKTRRIGELIVGYGQDDRVCAYTATQGLLEADPEYTSIVIGIDKEEIGSTGETGAEGIFLEQVIDKVIAIQTGRALSQITTPYIRNILSESRMISADVTFSANFRNITAGVVDEDNVAKAGYGFTIGIYNGSGNKYDGNQVSANYADELMGLFDKAGVVYQTEGIPSKVGHGGGGTIAKFFSARGIRTADGGVPLSGMHSKTEITHISDVYQTIKAFKTFLEV